jgi:hypothetical protein
VPEKAMGKPPTWRACKASQVSEVNRDATRAKALGPDLDRIAGTLLDKGNELDARGAA